MKQLTLRARLLLAVGLVAVVQGVAAVAVISMIRDQLLDQIDDRLTAAVAVAPVDGFTLGPSVGETASGSVDSWLGRGLGDVYQGVVASDGTLITVNEVVNRGLAWPPPEIGRSTIEASLDGPITVEAQSGDLEYRVLAVEANGDTLVVASPLRGYEWTINRLTRLVAITAAAVLLVLGAVAWWVLRLGIDPVKRMTTAAEAIAAGDLSERIEEADAATEAGQLGFALNTMMGRIQTSFDEQTLAEQRLRQFIADASHELRTPVATIRGYAELYEAGGLHDRAELDDAMRRTGQESQRMSRLIADMLNLAKLDRDPTVRADPVDLCALALEIVADATVTHEDRTIIADLGPGPIIVAGDEDLLRQALSNLVSNAIVHTEPNASATVTIAGDPTHATVMVEDDGQGMPDNVVGRSTERFYRADPSRSRHKGGSGLGLAIVASIAAAHQGSFQLRSVPGEGTTATLALPVAPQVDGSQPTPS